MSEILSSQSRKPLLNLQFLRGIGALLVVADHAIARLVKHGGYPSAYEQLAWRVGTVGVEVFFAISGFIMVYTMGDLFGRSENAGQFLRRRFLRIAPLYYLTTAAMIAMVVLLKHEPPPALSELARSLAFIPYWSAPGMLRPVYELGWTLNWEVFFYLLFAAAMLLPLRIGLPLVLAVLAMLAGGGQFAPDGEMATGQLGALAAFYADPIALYFALGVVIAVLHRRWGARQTRAPDLLLCAVAGAALLIAGISAQIPDLLAALLAVALASLLRGAAPAPRWGAICRVLGDTSYAVYLTHSFILGPICAAFVKLPFRGPMVIVIEVVIAWCMALILAWLTWRYVERPIHGWLARRRATPAPQLATS